MLSTNGWDDVRMLHADGTNISTFQRQGLLLTFR